jgi:hypothetical protein
LREETEAKNLVHHTKSPVLENDEMMEDIYTKILATVVDAEDKASLLQPFSQHQSVLFNRCSSQLRTQRNNNGNKETN